MRGDEAGASKRRRAEPEDALWQLRPVSDLKMSSIYNRSASEAPAELFRFVCSVWIQCNHYNWLRPNRFYSKSDYIKHRPLTILSVPSAIPFSIN